LSELWAYDYTGGAFIQGGGAHLGAIVVISLLVLFFWRLKLTDFQRDSFRWALAVLMLVNEVGWHAWHVCNGLWTVQEMLPLEICNLMVIASIWTLISRSQSGYEFIYLLGIPAASQVLITPALGNYGFPHLLFFQIFISHGGIVIAALYLTLGERMRPRDWRAVWRVAGVTMLYALAIFFLNMGLGSNYLFLAYKPPAATLIDYLGPWPWYGGSMAAIGIALAVSLYLPFAFKDRAMRNP
jgi:hypothetical integral membrane protein (TIGR02206 family)